MPLLFISTSLFSYNICKDYIASINQNTKIVQQKPENFKNVEFNRPKINTPLYSKTVIINKNGLDKEAFMSFSKKYYPELLKNSIQGVCWSEPIQDSNQAMYMLLSGIQSNFHGCKNGYNHEDLDNLMLVAKQNGKRVSFFSNNNTTTDDKAIKEMKDTLNKWKQFDLIIFDFNQEQDLESWKNLYFEPIMQKITDSEFLFFCSLIPESKTKPFSTLKQFYESPFLLSAKNIGTTLPAVKIRQENMTATLAFTLGLSLPNDCLGYPELDFFSLSEKEKVDRGTSSVKNFIINSVKLLYQYNINESIIAGYLMESTDAIDLSPAKTTKDLYQRWIAMKQEISSFTLETRQKLNLKISLIFLGLFLFFFIIWLLFSIKYYRSFIYGIFLTLAFLLMSYFVFRIPYSLPGNNLFFLRWYIFHFSIPLLISAFLISALYTILSGYVFDITMVEIVKDINGIISTFSIFLLGEMALIINFKGFRPELVAPGYFFISILIRNLSLFVLMGFTLIFMYLVSLVVYKLLIKYGPKPTK